MPRKGSRKISIDGKNYLWSLRTSNRYIRWDEEQPAMNAGTLTVQEDVEKPGRVAQTSLLWRRTTSVTPEVIRAVIRRFIVNGWNPSERGKAAAMADIDVDLIETRDSIIRSVMEP